MVRGDGRLCLELAFKSFPSFGSNGPRVFVSRYAPGADGVRGLLQSASPTGRSFVSNRFKSILVEEEAYFLQLVRSIHLNPLRVRLVRNVAELDSWSWSGHSVLMGQAERPWQTVDYVLGQFGRTAGGARRKYRGFVLDGVGEGRRPDLVGGGLIRSIYGREAAVPLRRGVGPPRPRPARNRSCCPSR